MKEIAELSTPTLDSDMVSLVKGERESQWKLIERLVEFDRRRAWSDYGSLWTYCSRRLGLLDGAIYQRVHAMEVVRDHPQVIAYLREEKLWMTSLVTLQPILSKENADEVFARAAGKSTREIENLAKSYKAPIAARPPFIRKVAAPVIEESSIDVSSSPAPAAPAPIESGFALTAPPALRKGEAKPVAANQHVIRIYVDDEFMEILQRAKEIVSHSVATGDITGVIRHALAEVVKKHERRQDPTRRIDAKPWDIHDPYIPEALRREVMKRDHCRCVWEFEAGGVCGSKWQVQVDHIVAVALGGLTIESNLRTLCRKHNLQHARNSFGEEYVEHMIAKRRGSEQKP